MVQNLKERGVQFPSRDEEGIFTASPMASVVGGGIVSEPPATAQYTVEQLKEILDVARNSVELLSTVFTSSPPQEVLKVCHYLTFPTIHFVSDVFL
jgi:hypothetical protein